RDHLVPSVRIHLEERRLVVDARVVHEYVDPPPALERSVDGALHILAARDVRRERPARAAQRDGLLERLERPPEAEDVGALGGEPLRDRAADPAARARDDDVLALEASHPFTAPAVSPRMKKRWPNR